MRANKAAAAAPNSSIIGGAGTGVIGGPLDPELPLELLDEAEDVEDEPDELPVDPELPDELLLPEELLLLDPFELQPLDDHPLDDQPLLLEP